MSKFPVEENNPMRNAITGIMVSIFAGALGFGISQATLAVEVKQHTVEMQHLKEMDLRQFNDLQDERTLLREVIKQNQEFINLLRVQTELLQKYAP